MKFIPRQKLSKKAKRALDEAQRATWQVNPVTRQTQNKKAYARKKSDRCEEFDPAGFFFYKGNVV